MRNRRFINQSRTADNRKLKAYLLTHKTKPQGTRRIKTRKTVLECLSETFMMTVNQVNYFENRLERRGQNMRPLETVYWLRFALGVIAAVICLGYGLAANAISSTQFSFNLFLNSMSLAIVVYLVSYYIIKSKFKLKVEKTQKLFTTGIGIYFLSWIVFYALFYTTLAGA